MADQRTYESATDRPFVSILMPVRNEEAFIESSLAALLDQTYPADRTEILVIDGRSEDDTRCKVRQVAARQAHPRIRLLDNPGRIAPTALNLGLQEIRGAFVIRIDGHSKAEESYVERAVELLSSGAADCVGGTWHTVGRTPAAAAIAAAMSSRFGVGNAAFRVAGRVSELQPVDSVPFPAYSRRAIERCGAFDEELVRDQDDEYNYRLRKFGGTVALGPGMSATYFCRPSLVQLFSQYRQYGFWKVRVLQKHPRQTALRQFAPAALAFVMAAAALLFLIGLVLPETTPFQPLALGSAVGFVVLAGTYAAASITATFGLLVARKVKPASAWRLPLAFAALHYGYGIGFLQGLVAFAGRWFDREGRVPELRLGRPLDGPEQHP